MTTEQTCPACGTAVRPSVSHCTWCGGALRAPDRAEPDSEIASFQWSRKEEPATPATAQPEAPSSPGPVAVAPARPGRQRTRSGPRAGLVTVAALVLLLLGAGTAAAFTVPIRTLEVDRPVEHMLPATTALYVAADLNPTGANKTHLDAIVRDFTSQPGWARFVRDFNDGTHRTSDSATCVDRTQHDAQTIFSQLGHRAAFALINPRGFSTGSTSAVGVSSQTTQAFERTAVVLVPLDRSITLVQALSSSDFSLPQRTQTYAGTTIYQDTITACQKANSSAPQTFYGALYHGYVVLALRPEPIERVIDTDQGKLPALATNKTFRTLANRLPVNALGLYYLDGKALLRSNLQSLAAYPGFSTTYRNAAQPTAGALTVDGAGFHLTTVNLGSAAPNTQAAGALARQLPGSTLAFISLQGVDKLIRTTVSQLEQSGFVSGGTRSSIDAVTTDLTADMAGETDLVMLNPTGPMTLNGSDTRSIPLALVWQIRDEGSANQHLDDLALHQLGLAGQLSSHTADDGSSFQASAAGYGYAVHNHWAVVSLSMDQVLGVLSRTPPSSLAGKPSYSSVLAGVDRPVSTWYFDLHGLRLALEQAITPLAPAHDVAGYNHDALPLLAPLKTLTGSAGRARDGVATSRLSVLIGPATETSARTR